MRKFLATTALGLAVTTGSVAIASFTPLGTAFAQETAPTTQTQPGQPGQDQGARQGKHPRARQMAKAGIKDAAGVIGIAPKDLVAELRDGKSIADVANAHGVAPQTVVDKLVADASTKLDQAVSTGKLSAERAATIKSKLNAGITRLVEKHFDGSHRPGTATQG